MVILITNRYTKIMERIDPRISQAISLLAEALDLPEDQAGARLYASFKDCDLTTRFINDYCNLSDDQKRISQRNVILNRDRAG